MLKMKMVQAFIQIERPVGWTHERIQRMAMDLKMIELYNSVAKEKLEQTLY